MTTKRKIEIFSAGCAACEISITEIKALACPSCEIVVLDMKDPSVAKRAADLGVQSVPGVLIDGNVADCCSGRGVDLKVLQDAGLGRN